MEIVEDAPIVPPPATMTVDRQEPKVLLYGSDGKPLTSQRRIGFVTIRSSKEK